MKNTVTLFGLEIEVTINEDETFEYTTSCGDVYEQAAITTDGRLVAFDDSVAAWVQLAAVA